MLVPEAALPEFRRRGSRRARRHQRRPCHALRPALLRGLPRPPGAPATAGPQPGLPSVCRHPPGPREPSAVTADHHSPLTGRRSVGSTGHQGHGGPEAAALARKEWGSERSRGSGSQDAAQDRGGSGGPTGGGPRSLSSGAVAPPSQPHPSWKQRGHRAPAALGSCPAGRSSSPRAGGHPPPTPVSTCPSLSQHRPESVCVVTRRFPSVTVPSVAGQHSPEPLMG